MTKQQYLTELVAESYKTWTKGDVILLGSPTGTGKTTLCITLAEYALLTQDKILYITSRLAKLEEFKTDTADFAQAFYYTTFQKLEQDISYRNIKILNSYVNCKYIFIDECHYFTDDIAIPDSNASLSEEWLRKVVVSPIKIYASATARRYFGFLRSQINIPDDHIYEVEKNYFYVTECIVYRKDQGIGILQDILQAEPDSKILFFVNNTNRMEELQATFGHDIADYLCSSSASDTYLRKLCNLTNDSFAGYGFEKRILFATKTIELGVNIIDRNLRYIFCEMQDPNTIAQCLGRKRAIDEKDTCKFYICNQDAKSLALHNNNIRKFINAYDEYCRDPNGFILKHRDDRNLNKGGSVFILTPGNDKIQIDSAKVRKYKSDMRFYDYVKENGFIEALKLTLDDYLAKIIKPYSIADNIVDFLRSNEGIRFYDEDKDIIKNYFSSIIDGKRTFGLKVINDWLDKNIGETYTKRLISKKDCKRMMDDGTSNVKYNKNYWIIE